MLQVALNGSRERGTHSALPVTADELAEAAVASVAAGASMVHVHPRDGAGRESLDPDVVGEAVKRIRAVVEVPVGVTTGAWIEPDPARRTAMVAQWTEPDLASV